jgi:hypothetical protein
MSAASRIVYAADALSTDDISKRIPRARQSAAAAALLERLSGGLAPTASSKSHSRGVVAAAAGDAPDLQLGIDIEWMAPGRPFSAIARTVLPIAPERMPIGDFYRGWTFFEAYYKAFQEFPRSALVEQVIYRTAEVGAHRLVDGSAMAQRRVADAFQLCLVWRDAGADLIVPRDLSASMR